MSPVELAVSLGVVGVTFSGHPLCKFILNGFRDTRI